MADHYKLSPDKGKRILITGGCGGIGHALVEAALELELEVAVFDLPDALQKVPLPDAVQTYAVDVSQAEQVHQAFEQLGKNWAQMDYLVNLVGFIREHQPIRDFSIQGWEYMIQGNLHSAFLCSRAAIPFLSPGGAIVNMSSGLAFIGQKGYGPYSASKAAIISLTKTMAAELAPHIRVNAVAPGAVQTSFLSGGLGQDLPPQRVDLEAYIQRVPLGRIAWPKDIVGPLLFLLSEAAAYITGETLHINGGALMV